MIKVGLDYWNTISRAPELFADLASSIISEGGEVYVVSAIGPRRSKEQTLADIKKSGVPYNDAIVCVWEKSHKEAPELKLEVCKKLGIELFFDDRADTCQHLVNNGIHAFNYMKFKDGDGLRHVEPKTS